MAASAALETVPLLEEVNLDDADAARLTLAAKLGRVLAGWDRHDERGFWLRRKSQIPNPKSQAILKLPSSKKKLAKPLL